MTEIREFKVEEGTADVRLDKFLATQMPQFSRSEIQRFGVLRAGRAVKFSERVRPGDVFSVTIPDAVQTDVAADNVSSDFDLDILFEDDDIIVVNKPRGVVMYPSAGNKTGTLVQNILSYTHLVKIFSAHDLTRKYVAFVWGVPNWTGADITGNIARSSRNRQKMSMVKTGGRPAHTVVNVMDVWSRVGVSALRCTLMTGRTHQIRVHLSAHGFPVLCDPVYGRGAARLGSVKNPDLLDFIKTHDGQMLHAEVLEFIHPVTGAPMHFRAPLPDDMATLRCILEETE